MGEFLSLGVMGSREYTVQHKIMEVGVVLGEMSVHWGGEEGSCDWSVDLTLSILLITLVLNLIFIRMVIVSYESKLLSV